MNKSVAIIGAGISGLSLANMLKDNFVVDVYENNEKPGGLVQCERVEGNLFHKVGGHVFNSKNPDVLKWFWSFFERDKEFIKTKRNAKILLNWIYIGYPIENHLFELEHSVTIKILKEIIRDSQNENEPLANFKSFLQKKFGQTLFHLYFEPYNEKIW